MYDVPTIGLNYRLSDINAALGRKQLARIGEISQRRRDNFAHLRARIASFDGLSVIDARDAAAPSAHYCLTVILEAELASRRNAVVQIMKERGVGTRVYYPQ